MKVLVMAVVLSLVLSPVVIAGCGSCAVGAKTADMKNAMHSHEVINSACPVTGEKISKDTKITTEYNGKTIGFCCSACKPAFEKNPEKYMDKIHAN